jgi:hypothetical protein
VPPARPQLPGEAIRSFIGSPPAATRMAAAARTSLSTRFTEAALRDALLAYATGPIYCQRGVIQPAYLTPGLLPVTGSSHALRDISQRSAGEAGVKWDS